MEAFEPLINLLVLFTILSLAGERATNIIKLKSNELRVRKKDEDGTRKREQKINIRNILINIFFSLIIKANFFEIITHLNDPWKTLGWVQLQDNQWVLSHALDSLGMTLLAVVGCIVMGISLGFGSKFWHDILGIIYEIRNSKRKLNEK
jgi:ABC-type Fe3+ transport system permease subunit